MDLIFYIVASAVYIMVIHFALAIKNEFNLFLMIGYFVLGGVLGMWLNAYDVGFVLSVVLSLLFW
jgi:hypothetical protein